MHREKMKLEQEKTQKEADIKIKNGEVLALQKELDAVSNTVKQLEMQKAEAQKRLDELDDKVISILVQTSCCEIGQTLVQDTDNIKILFDFRLVLALAVWSDLCTGFEMYSVKQTGS